MEELLKFAKKIALRMSKDPEVESIAGNALLRALRTYDGRVHLYGWISVCVKMEVRDFWRRHNRIKFMPETWWENVYEVEEPATIDMDPYYWQILCEKYLEKWPLDVVARRHGKTVYRIRKDLEAAITAFQEAYNGR